MPLSSSSPYVHHPLKNISLILLSLLFAPLVTLIAIAAHLASYTSAHTTAENARQQRLLSGTPRHTVLVTGVGMTKGLFIARAFHRSGHTVIGADFEPCGIPACGRFSRSLAKFYRLQRPGLRDSRGYAQRLVDIVKEDDVDIWVSCSGVASALEDAGAAEMVEAQTACKVIQFGKKVTHILHEKDSFIRQAAEFGLNVPETHYVASAEDAMAVLHPQSDTRGGVGGDDKATKYIMKPVGMDDSRRANMTLLPLSTRTYTHSHVYLLAPTASRPFVLQQFIKGEEYCTHSIIIRGKIKAFTACPSAELLMHYRVLPGTSPLLQAMLRFTERYVGRMGEVTGHISVDFMLDTTLARTDDVHELKRRLYPIECNPRAHTAVVLFEGAETEMVDGYLSVLEDKERRDSTSASSPPAQGSNITIPSPRHTYYWIGHDLLTLIILPLLSFLTLNLSLTDFLCGAWVFRNHLLYQKDGTFEIWDPWPFWWLYIICWPALFVEAIWHWNWWSRCNVSTMKMFRC